MKVSGDLHILWHSWSSQLCRRRRLGRGCQIEVWRNKHTKKVRLKFPLLEIHLGNNCSSSVSPNCSSCHLVCRVYRTSSHLIFFLHFLPISLILGLDYKEQVAGRSAFSGKRNLPCLWVVSTWIIRYYCTYNTGIVRCYVRACFVFILSV